MDKGEGILGLYSFPVMGRFGHAEGTDCTFAEIFRGARTLKRFSCQTGTTLETISVNQVRQPDVKLKAAIALLKSP